MKGTTKENLKKLLLMLCFTCIFIFSGNLYVQAAEKVIDLNAVTPNGDRYGERFEINDPSIDYVITTIGEYRYSGEASPGVTIKKQNEQDNAVYNIKLKDAVIKACTEISQMPIQITNKIDGDSTTRKEYGGSITVNIELEGNNYIESVGYAPIYAVGNVKINFFSKNGGKLLLKNISKNNHTAIEVNKGSLDMRILPDNTKIVTAKAGDVAMTPEEALKASLNQTSFSLEIAEKAPKVGTQFSIDNYTYEITNDKTNGTGTVKVVGFAKGKSAASVKFASAVKFKEYSYQVTAVGDKAFYNNSKIKQINIGGNIKSIGKRAFYGCSKMTSAVIGSKVTQISDFAFYKCTNLNKFTVGTGIKTIGSHVFCHDKKLRSIDIKSKNLKTVGKHNLYKCTNLKIKVPSSKVKAYTKLFKNQGQKASVKVIK